MNTGIEALDVLAEQFARFPGVGRKSAQRMALALLDYTEEDIAAFTAAVEDAKAKIHRCPVCENLTDRDLAPCVPIPHAIKASFAWWRMQGP